MRDSNDFRVKRAPGRRAPACIWVLLSAIVVAPAAAQAPPSYDFDFATITATSNPAWGKPDPWNWVSGRGSVPYEYRIARVEVTTAQWMEFVNTYSVRGGSWTFFAEPTFWGADIDWSYSGPGRRYTLLNSPNAGMMPVGGITWREAAMFCNWLHNDKGTSLSAIENGAYDTTTFGSGGGLVFTDQHTRHPGAKYWIPSLDEWIKAAHYDPNRHGLGQGGWWEYSYRSDSPPTPGLPGQGQTTAGLMAPSLWEVPLGAYPEMQSPWGLFDTSGGTSEWTEDVIIPTHPTTRLVKGAGFDVLNPHGMEAIWGYDRIPPWAAGSTTGLRIASAVPPPSSFAIVLLSGLGTCLYRRRRS
jgi:formylglycine-generating enzyme required for sulfatase activity